MPARHTRARPIRIALCLLSPAMLALAPHAWCAEETQARSAPALDQLRKERQRMAHRERRIIFNNDGDDIGQAGADTVEGLLAARTTALLGSNVDAIWYYSTWGMKLHHAEGPFAELYAAQYETDGARQQVDNYRRILAATGKDTLEVMIDVARAHGLEVFYSNRMNDVHDAFFAGMSYLNRLAHPEWCLATREEGAAYGYPDLRSCWSAWNFEVPEIRRLTVEAMRAVCRHYDIDGIELDFWRHVIYFPESMASRAVTAEHLELMNRMMRSIRRMTEEEGLRRGRPILIAGRCLEDAELSRNSGLDVATWLQEGLVDMLTVGQSTEHTQPIYALTKLAAAHGVPVYPVCNSFYKSAMDDLSDQGAMLADLPVWRGDNLACLQQGAAGIQMFNLFDPHRPQWRELGDRARLLTMDRTYVWDYLPSQRKGRDTFGALRISRFRPPVTVTGEGCEPIPLYVGEDLSAPDPDPRPRQITLRVRALGLTREHQLAIALNGKRLHASTMTPPPTGNPADVWLHHDVKPGETAMGENLVSASVAPQQAPGPRIDQVRLDVRYAPSP